MSIGEAYFDDLGWEGRRVIVNDLKAVTGREVLRRVGALIGPAIESAASAGLDAKVEVAGAMAIGGILKRLDSGTVEWLTSTFMAVTLIEAEPGTEQWINPKAIEDMVFGGGAGQARWQRWMRFCLMNACGDFFADAFAQFGRAKASISKTESQSKAKFDPLTGSAASPSPSTSPNPGGFTA